MAAEELVMEVEILEKKLPVARSVVGRGEEAEQERAGDGAEAR